MSLWRNYLFFATCCLLFCGCCAHKKVGLTPEEEAEEQLVLRIREHILAGNAFALQSILSNVTNITTVARGFRYEQEQKALFTRVTPTRFGDPDVNAIRGFADSILFGNGDPDALAKVFTAVLYLQGPGFVADPASTFKGLFESFSNATEMQAILDADPQEIFKEEGGAGGKRRLAVKGTPADTPLCGACFEKKFCLKNAPWC